MKHKIHFYLKYFYLRFTLKSFLKMEFVVNVNSEHQESVAQLLRAWQKIGLIETFTVLKDSRAEFAGSFAMSDSTHQKTTISEAGYDVAAPEHYRDLVD